MSWVLDTRPRGVRPGLIGPGRLVLVVGPSGAGKDTLLKGAREACRDDASIIFPRRVITRPSSPSEDNDTVTAADFNQAAADGAFALWWDAHGNGYGIPSSIDDDIRSGRTVVCNVSRTIIRAASLRYSQAAVVLVTAPAKVLKERLAAAGAQATLHRAARQALRGPALRGRLRHPQHRLERGRRLSPGQCDPGLWILRHLLGRGLINAMYPKYAHIEFCRS